jgi:hypothetical protein
MAGCLSFRPFSADVVMTFEPPDLRDFPHLVAERDSSRGSSSVAGRENSLAPEIERRE